MIRPVKQTIIALIFLLFLISAGLGLYLLLGQGESTPTIAEGPRQDIEIVSTDYIMSGTNKVDLLAKIKNPNNDYAASSIRYQFSLLDSKGNTIGAKAGDNYILAGQSKYIVDVNVDIQNNDVAKAILILDNVVWNKAENSKDPRVVIKEKTFQSSSAVGVTTRASGFLINESNYNFRQVEIVAVLFDNNNIIIGLGKTELRTVLSKEKRYFEINWDKMFNKKAARLDIEAATNVLDDGNLLNINDGRDGRFLRSDE